jgi:DNA-binding winged helix-turn-helix (wHTH) protein/Tol biopolymer transport system component
MRRLMHLAARTPERYEFGPFFMDVEECELRCDGQPIPLPGKAFELLLVLVRRAGRTVGKAELLNALWSGTIVEESNLTQTVFLLRRALAETGGEVVYVETVPRRGYKFVAPLVELVPKPEPAQELPQVTVPPGALNPGSRSYGWIWPAVTSVSLLIAAGALFTSLRQPAGVDLSKYRYQPFAFSDEPEWSGAWSPDGKNIAFIRGGDTRFAVGKLMVQPFDSTRAVQVLEKAAYPLAWSADGTRIFYFGGDGVYVVSRAGGQPERILAGVRSFDVSRDGKAMAVWKAVTNGNGVRASVWISSPVGAGLREYRPAPFAVQGALSNGSASNEYLRFSPNGKLLYLSRLSENTTREAWLLPFPPGSGAPRRLFRNNSGFVPGAASWMPDNRRMVIANQLSLWLVDARTESMTRLDDGTNGQNDPAVSPDGKRLLLSRWTLSADLFELPLDGSPPRKLLATTLAEFSPSWSRKGDQFAFIRERNDIRELWVHSSQGEWDRLIVTPPKISPKEASCPRRTSLRMEHASHIE